MELRLILTPRAIADLGDIAEPPDAEEFEFWDPVEARGLAIELLREIDDLATGYKRGTKLPGQGDPDLRELIHRRYRITYEISPRDRTVSVYRVTHLSAGLPELM